MEGQRQAGLKVRDCVDPYVPHMDQEISYLRYMVLVLTLCDV